VNDKKCLRPQYRSKSHVGVLFDGKPRYDAQDYGHHSKKPDPMPVKEFFSFEAVVFCFNEEPVEEQEYQENTALDQ